MTTLRVAQPLTTHPLVMRPWHLMLVGLQFMLVPETRSAKPFAIAAHQLIHNVHTGRDKREQAQECRIS